MPERCVRFAVRGHDGWTSDVWKCWINVGRDTQDVDADKHDVYLTSRPLGHALKLSLHQSGKWHLSFHREKKEDLFPVDKTPTTRFLGKWKCNEDIEKPVILAARVIFPWSSPSLSDKNAPPDTIWIPSASESQAVEVLVFLVKRTEIFQHEYSQDTGLVGDIYFRDEGGVRLLYRHVQFETPPNFSGTPRYFRGISSADLSGASRMVSWGRSSDGSIRFVEARVESVGNLITK
jgi:hypothetical protein